MKYFTAALVLVTAGVVESVQVTRTDKFGFDPESMGGLAPLSAIAPSYFSNALNFSLGKDRLDRFNLNQKGGEHEFDVETVFKEREVDNFEDATDVENVFDERDLNNMQNLANISSFETK